MRSDEILHVATQQREVHMALPGFAAEVTLYTTNQVYAGAWREMAETPGGILPQGCGPCVNGRRQCVSFGGQICEQSPACLGLYGPYGPTRCPWNCYPAGPHGWSEPCGAGHLAPPPD